MESRQSFELKEMMRFADFWQYYTKLIILINFYFYF